MSNEQSETSGESAARSVIRQSGASDRELVYASDVHVLIEPASVHLVFTRFQAVVADPDHNGPHGDSAEAQPEIVARMVLPLAAVQRLARLLPDSLAAQAALASDYGYGSELPTLAANLASEAPSRSQDPFLAFLETVEIDDEPVTEDDREAIRAGKEAYLRGEFRPWEEVRRSLALDDDPPPASVS